MGLKENTMKKTTLWTGWIVLVLILMSLTTVVGAAWAQDDPRELSIPVLCVTPGGNPTGTVVHIMVLFAMRDDADGLDVHFIAGPSRFSQTTQAATTRAIAHVARALGLSANSWSVGLSVTDPGVIIEGDSLSAMVGLTVAAMAKGEAIPRSRVITGTVTSDGRIGPVGGVGLKVLAARQAGLQMVLVPSMADKKGKTPVSTKVFMVSSVSQAYQALTSPKS
jgi:predicted S18 family serine protease